MVSVMIVLYFSYFDVVDCVSVKLYVSLVFYVI